MACELWVLIYDELKIQSIIVISMLKQPASLSAQRKHYTLIEMTVHGEQIEPSPIFIACFSCEL